MSTYELDDELVRRFVGLMESATDHDDLNAALAHKGIAEALKDQIPIPAPVLPAAIVKAVGGKAGREDEESYYFRWTGDERTHSPWIEYGNHEQPYRTDEIGRVTEIISNGYDLPLLP